MKNQIFNGQGFLKEDAKPFIEEHLINGLKKILSTAKREEDLKTIGCILSNIIGKEVFEAIQEMKKNK